jgi:Xaa-Pro aminopeptidase
MFTSAEQERRHQAVRNLIQARGLKAVLLIGDTNVGHGFYGDLRYFTNCRTIFHRHVAVVFPAGEPILFSGTAISTQAARRTSFVRDCREIGENQAADIVTALRERGVLSGQVGINFLMLPAAWLSYLNKELPGIELVETHPEIMEIRFSQHSAEEAEIFREGAALCDGAFEAALKVIRPGATEYEIAAEIEHFARARGAEEHFTLVGSGRFSFGDDNALPLPFAPSGRRIEAGDSIVMEITPRYQGYWTQLVRTVNVGRPNSDLAKIHEVCLRALEKGLEVFKAGARVMDVGLAMETYVKTSGFVLKPPLGHVCGVDLVDDRVNLQNTRVLEPGMAVIVHPTIFTPDGKRSFFWGETYLVTKDGYERLQHTGHALLTV